MPIKQLDLRHLRYVVATARNGSFSAAGHELNVQQPIISKRIRELEGELEVDLFDRTTTGERLTPVGKEFVVDAQRILEDVEQLAERSRRNGAGERGRVIVGFYKSLSAGGLRASIRAFRQQYPEIDLELVENPHIELTADVLAGRLDAAIILGDSGTFTSLDAIQLWSEHLMVALPEDHRLGDSAFVYWTDLKGDRFLMSHHDPGPDICNILLRNLAAPSDQPEIVRRYLPGQITAQVTQHIYESPTGRILLVPQGTRIIGEYSNDVGFGQRRVLLVWNRLIFPDGRSIVLERQPGGERL